LTLAVSANNLAIMAELSVTEEAAQGSSIGLDRSSYYSSMNHRRCPHWLKIFPIAQPLETTCKIAELPPDRNARPEATDMKDRIPLHAAY